VLSMACPYIISESATSDARKIDQRSHLSLLAEEGMRGSPSLHGRVPRQTLNRGQTPKYKK